MFTSLEHRFVIFVLDFCSYFLPYISAIRLSLFQFILHKVTKIDGSKIKI